LVPSVPSIFVVDIGGHAFERKSPGLVPRNGLEDEQCDEISFESWLEEMIGWGNAEENEDAR